MGEYLDIWYVNMMWNKLSSINIGDKLSICGNTLHIEKNTPLLPIKRRYYGNKRTDIYIFFENLFYHTIQHFESNNHVKHGVESYKLNIIKGFNGLLNVRQTYSDDIDFISTINSKLEKINKLTKYYEYEDEYKEFNEIKNKIIFYNESNESNESNEIN